MSNTFDDEKSILNKEIQNVISGVITVLEAFGSYNELDIEYEYSIGNTQGIQMGKDINEYIGKYVISELKKKYIGKVKDIGKAIIKLSQTQIDTIQKFNDNLNKIEKSHILNLNPEVLFTIKENEEKPLIVIFRERLRILADFFTDLIDADYSNGVLADTLDTLLDKFNLIDEINTDSIKFIFSANLRNILDKKGLSQRKLAAKLSVRPQTVNQWCQAGSFPNISNILETANALEIDVDYLLKPNSTEIDLSDAAFSKQSGLSVEAIIKMKKELESGTHYKNHIVKLLDLLIHNYHDYGNDLLSEIADYLKPHYEKNLYLISDYELNSLADDIIEDCKDIKDVKDKIRGFTHIVETNLSRDDIYDVSNIQLQNILKVLVRIKDNLDK